MIRKRAFLVLAVGVLMGTMAVSGFADYSDRDLYEPGDSSVSMQPEQDMGRSDAGEIREPIGTGALPDTSVDRSVQHCCSEGSSDPTFWPGGP
jgi:hypothetical protein